MSRFTLTRSVANNRASVFMYLTDAAHLRQWLPWTEEIEDVSGPLDRAGTTFSQRGAKGIRRPGGVVASNPPNSWDLRIAGFGERVDLQFRLRPVASGTTISLDVTVRNGPGALGAFVDLFARTLDRRGWARAFDRLIDALERPPVVVEIGDFVSVEGGGIIRVAQVIGAEEQHVHLRLFAGRYAVRPELSELDALDFGRPRDHHAMQPLTGTIRSAAFSPTRGAPSLLTDGGFGIRHLPMTRRAFDAAEPHRIGRGAIPEGVEATIASWRRAGGAAFGEVREPRIGAFYSVALQALGVEGIGFGILKLLRQQFRGVHVRVYSNALDVRPTQVDESILESRPAVPLISSHRPMTAPLAIGHLPLKHASFTAWQPEFIETTLVQPDEMLGYEEWKLAKGGFF